jgi:hypothetical protein
MWDLFTSALFVGCQSVLLVLVASPLLFADIQARPRRSSPVARLCLPVALGLVLVAAAINVLSSASSVPVQSLAARVLAGQTVSFQFDPEACRVLDLGNILCGEVYRGRYERGGNRWIVTGPQEDPQVIITSESENSEPIAGSLKGSLNVWGVSLYFDPDGALYRFGQKIGALQIETSQPEPSSGKREAETEVGREPTLRQRAMRGETMTVMFSADTCVREDLGTLQCGVEYEARYERKANQWTVTGPGKHSNGMVTSSADNAEPRPGSISVWGMVNSFDDNGDLKFLGKKVGRIWSAIGVRE